MITKEDIELEGWATIMSDTFSFVSEFADIPVWKELWYDMEKKNLEIFSCTTLDTGAIVREVIFSGFCDTIKDFREILLIINNITYSPI